MKQAFVRCVAQGTVGAKGAGDARCSEGLPLEIAFPCGAPDHPLSEVFMLLVKIACGSCGRRLGVE
jgi:hypothetical protein